MSATDKSANSLNIKIRTEMRTGDIGYLTYLHGLLYAQACNWDHTFEADVAGILADFARSQNDRERIWVVEKDGQAAGSIGIVEATARDAQLRIFLLHPDLRGQGLGKRLIIQALEFCRERNYTRVFLLTTSELTAAAHLYRSAGFQLTQTQTYERWGTTVTEERYDLHL